MTHQQAVETLATERYLLNDMSVADRDAFEEHFFSCEVCADDIRVSAAMAKGGRAGFAAAATTGRVLPMVSPAAATKQAWYRSTVVPWAAAAALAAITTYQSIWVVPSLRRDDAPMALVPVSLRPASRGAEPVVPLPANRAPITLAVEINEPADGQLIYDLKTADGRSIVSGHAATPAAGAPLLLLIPSTLVVPTHYILSVHDARSSNRELGEYRFAVSAQ